jgi:Putative Actinobacterial Holin-X, holin superfamily III
MSLPNERTLPEVLQGAIGNIQEIIRSEFRLARAEITAAIGKISGSAAMIGVGLGISLYAIGFILLAIVYKLSAVMEAWAAALLVGGILALLAIVTLVGAASKLRHVNAIPEKTVETMKENLTWAKRQMK